MMGDVERGSAEELGLMGPEQDGICCVHICLERERDRTRRERNGFMEEEPQWVAGQVCHCRQTHSLT